MKSGSARILRARPSLGTLVEIAVEGAAPSDMEAATEAAFAVVEQVHRLMSFHEPDSDVSRLNNESQVRTVTIHPWTFCVLETAIEMTRRTMGIFDVAVVPSLQRLGLLPRSTVDLAPSASSADAIELLSDSRVRFRSPVRIDLGGIAKGFAVDHAIEALRSHGMPRGSVNAGGDVAAFGQPSHSIDVRHPAQPDRLMCHVALTDEALASTGAAFDPWYSSYGGGSAIINPHTGSPVHAVRGATVRATSCMIADALTKVVMISSTGASDALRHYGARALFVASNGEVWATSNWRDAVQLAA
jgi:FAD:protein FMN transferase